MLQCSGRTSAPLRFLPSLVIIWTFGYFPLHGLALLATGDSVKQQLLTELDF